MPVKIAIEKLRGFVADHQARIVAIDGNQVRLEIDDKPASRLRRLTDRPVALLRRPLRSRRSGCRRSARERRSPAGGGTTRTKIKIAISPRRSRDRRRDDVMARAREVLMSFRSYLMASRGRFRRRPTGAMARLKRILTPWLA